MSALLHAAFMSGSSFAGTLPIAAAMMIPRVLSRSGKTKSELSGLREAGVEEKQKAKLKRNVNICATQSLGSWKGRPTPKNHPPK